MTDYSLLLDHCETKEQVACVEAVIQYGPDRACEYLGVNRRSVYRMLSRVKARAGLVDPVETMPLTGQSRLMRGDTEILRWDKTRTRRDAHLEPIYREMIAGAQIRLARPVAAPTGTQDICSVVVLADAHIGLLAHGFETGGDSTSTDRGFARIRAAIDHLLPVSHTVKHGILLNMGDLMHFDGMKLETPQSGNPVESDTTYGGMFRKATALLRYAIDLMLQRCETVHVMNVRGNHDESSLLALNVLLQNVYENEPRLTIPDNDCLVMTHAWEGNFLYCHHGNGVKQQAMYNAMTRDYSQDFGSANHVWCVSGHVHNERLQWIGKAKMEIVNTLAPVDAWHASKLYGSHRSMDRVDLHPKGCEIGRTTFNPVLHEAA